MVLGSPGYMAPEQVAGQPVGHPADVFSLGSVLVFAATAGGPFGEGPTPAMLYRVVNNDPDLAAVPDSVRPLIARCTARRPEDRPSARELLALLGALDQTVVFSAETETDAAGRWLPVAVHRAIEEQGATAGEYLARLAGALTEVVAAEGGVGVEVAALTQDAGEVLGQPLVAATQTADVVSPQSDLPVRPLDAGAGPAAPTQAGGETPAPVQAGQSAPAIDPIAAAPTAAGPHPSDEHPHPTTPPPPPPPPLPGPEPLDPAGGATDPIDISRYVGPAPDAVRHSGRRRRSVAVVLSTVVVPLVAAGGIWFASSDKPGTGATHGGHANAAGDAAGQGTPTGPGAAPGLGNGNGLGGPDNALGDTVGNGVATSPSTLPASTAPGGATGTVPAGASPAAGGQVVPGGARATTTTPATTVPKKTTTTPAKKPTTTACACADTFDSRYLGYWGGVVTIVDANSTGQVDVEVRFTGGKVGQRVGTFAFYDNGSFVCGGYYVFEHHGNSSVHAEAMEGYVTSSGPCQNAPVVVAEYGSGEIWWQAGNSTTQNAGVLGYRHA